MREPTIAKNYADALLEIGERSGNTERYAELMAAFALAIEEEPRLRLALESPRVPKETKFSTPVKDRFRADSVAGTRRSERPCKVTA